MYAYAHVDNRTYTALRTPNKASEITEAYTYQIRLELPKFLEGFFQNSASKEVKKENIFRGNTRHYLLLHKDTVLGLGRVMTNGIKKNDSSMDCTVTKPLHQRSTNSRFRFTRKFHREVCAGYCLLVVTAHRQ